MSQETVVPNLEFVPKRSYSRDGAIITCRAIIADNGSFLDSKFVLGDPPLFVLELPSEAVAEQLMEDLYYGEYTGA